MGGCGSKISTSTLYDNPSWMPDGRIICNKLVVTTTQQLYGTGISESHSYIAALTINDNNEVIKEENLFEGGVGGSITCSPVGELIAFGEALTSGITISDYRGNTSVVPNVENVTYSDWSPDGNRLVYSSGRKLFIINKDGTGKTQIASDVDTIAWRYGDKIAYVGDKLTLINPDGTGTLETVVGGRPQIKSNGDIVYQYLAEIKTINSAGTNEVTLFSGYQPYTFKLSFDGQKIAGGALGDPGIWVINIDGTGYVRLR